MWGNILLYPTTPQFQLFVFITHDGGERAHKLYTWVDRGITVHSSISASESFAYRSSNGRWLCLHSLMQKWTYKWVLYS